MRNAVAIAGDVDLMGTDIGLLRMDLENAIPNRYPKKITNKLCPTPLSYKTY